MLAAIDWTNVLDTAIITVPAIIAALYARSIHSSVQTPSKRSIGKQVESAHQTAIANNMLLSAKNGPTKKADPSDLLEHEADSPQVPAE